MRLELSRIGKRYGGRDALTGVSLALAPGRIRALVGENGAGKSTLVKVACGIDERTDPVTDDLVIIDEEHANQSISGHRHQCGAPEEGRTGTFDSKH